MSLEKAEFTRKATRIAAIMGYSIIFPDERNKRATLSENGMEITLNNSCWDARNARIVITGFIPSGRYNYHPYDCKSQQITVAETKTAEQIVKDIERRLLPPYRIELEKAHAAIKDNDKYIDQRNEQILKLARETGIAPTQTHESTGDPGMVWIAGSTFKIGGQDSINIDRMGYIETSKAIRIAKILLEA